MYNTYYVVFGTVVFFMSCNNVGNLPMTDFWVFDTEDEAREFRNGMYKS